MARLTRTPPGAEDLIRARLADSIESKRRLLESEAIGQVSAVVALIVTALRAGRRPIFFGNGGSCADAQHIAAELIGRLRHDRAPLAALSLPTSLGAMTAIANDYGYDQVFARELRANARPGDVAIGLSTSGNSGNVRVALTVARELGLGAVAFTGRSGGQLVQLADICVRVPSDDTQRVQELCMHLGHTICELVEREMLGCGS